MSDQHGDRAVRFPASAMSGLIDVAVRYDLAESTCPPLRLGELGDPTALADLSLGYGTTAGDKELRELIGAEASVGAEHVLVTSGAAGAMFLVAQDICPGSVVMVGPCFPPAAAVPTGLGSPVDIVRTRFDDGYRLPLDAVADALSPTTRMVSIASPQNPSGVGCTDQELRDLVTVVDERAPDAIVLVDETYRESTYGDAPVPRSAAALSPKVVTTASLSKAHGAPGLRVGWLVATDPERYERLRNAKFLSTIACSTADEYLGTQVLRRRDEILAPRASSLARALAELERWIVDQPVDLVRPDGGALCCLRLDADRFPADAVPAFYERLAARDARVAPGSWFGDDDGDRVFRLGFGHLSPPDFTEALTRLADALAD
jgi:hypothetical protein